MRRDRLTARPPFFSIRPMNRTSNVVPFALALGLTGLVACQQGAPSAPPAQKAKPASKPAAKAAPSQAANSPTNLPAALMDPSKANETAPDTYAVKFETTAGDVIIDVTRAWAPNGADRFYNLVNAGFYDDVAFFRVISGFMAQVGISGNPKLSGIWRKASIQDDPVKESNTRGMVTFATAGPNTRTTQIFINFGNNARLDGMGFAPFGKVRDMATVDKLHAGYGEGAPRGRGPSQGRIQSEGNTYLRADFDKLDYIKKATIMK